MKTNTRLCSITKLYSPRFGLSTFCMSTFFGRSMFWYFDVLVWFGLSTFWSVDVSVCRRFGLLMFWYVDILVCRRFSFGLSTFRYVSVSVRQRFGLSTFWPVTYKRVHFDTPNPVYEYGHHFADDISEWISSMTFFIISLYWVLLLKYNLHFTLHRLYIVNIFQHSNILTRASHHWCLASNIVLVLSWYHVICHLWWYDQ